MKKLISFILLLSLALCLLPGSLACAEEPSAAERGLEKLQTARNWQRIVLPKEESYLDEWKTLYARRAWFAPNLAVMSAPELDSGLPNAPYVFEGTQVTVVAEENDMSCMLYRAPSHKLYVGWIQSIRLLEDFPGESYTAGTVRESGFAPAAEPTLSWSTGRCFPGTNQAYTLLDEPLEGCVGFTYEYQVVAENDALPEAIVGERTIYVHDGEQWVEVGSFPYTGLGAVKVEVWLDEPMSVTAIGSTAACRAAHLIEFRQTARDFLVES